MTELHLLPADLDVQAAELAFGLLEGADEAAALKREREDSKFAARVSEWRTHGQSWLQDLAPDVVDDRVWLRIQAALRDGRPTSEHGLGRAGERWRRFAMLATAASLAMAVALGVTLASRPSRSTADMAIQPTREMDGSDKNIAQIADKSGVPLLSAVYYPQTGTLTMRVSDLETPEKAPELWVLDDAGKPHSLGLIDKRGSLTIELSEQLRALLVEGATVAITVEDRDGSPHDAPTGEILGTAKLSTI